MTPLSVAIAKQKRSETNQPGQRRRAKFQNCSPRSAHAIFLLALVFGVFFVPHCLGYSVLTHEAIIDAAWNDGIQPLLLQRFPNATPEELLEAHAYAYGGSIIQDMEYYRFGSRFFSDLTHYVRSGEFVSNLNAIQGAEIEVSRTYWPLSVYMPSIPGGRQR